MNYMRYSTRVGEIGLAERDGKIARAFFSDEAPPEGAQKLETPALRAARAELEAYLSGHLRHFSVPLDPEGTDFQKTVWACLLEIPFGTTLSYKQVAVKIGKPQASRAVGMANNRNPIPLFIPCHRVVGSDGSLVGYRGGLGLKKLLLELEKSNAQSQAN